MAGGCSDSSSDNGSINKTNPSNFAHSFIDITGLVMIIVAGYVAFMLGLFLMRPVLSENGESMLNIVITVMVSAILFTGLLSVVRNILHALLLLAMVTWLVGPYSST